MKRTIHHTNNKAKAVELKSLYSPSKVIYESIQLRKLLLICLIDVEPELYALVMATKSFKIHPTYQQ